MSELLLDRATCAGPPRRRASGAVSRHTSSGTPTPSRWHAKVAADRDPAPIRLQQSRHHIRLLAGHPQRRDHRNRPLTPRADDPRHRIAAALQKPSPGAARAEQPSSIGAAE